MRVGMLFPRSAAERIGMSVSNRVRWILGSNERFRMRGRSNPTHTHTHTHTGGHTGVCMCTHTHTHAHTHRWTHFFVSHHSLIFSLFCTSVLNHLCCLVLLLFILLFK